MNYKSTLILLCCVSLLSSCKVYHAQLSGTKSTYSPSVTLKTGEKITGKEVRERTPLLGRDKIQIDETKYPAKDVAFYETSRSRYANVGGSSFAEQKIEGKINVYESVQQYTTTSYNSGTNGGMSGFHTQSHVKVIDYIQKGDDAPVVYFNRRTVESYVRPYKPSMDLLALANKDVRNQKLSAIAGGAVVLAGLATIIAGTGKFLSSNTSGTEGFGFFYAGAGMMLGGTLGAFIPISIFRYKAKQHTWEAISAYNRQ
jgi:hypothetical protein